MFSIQLDIAHDYPHLDLIRDTKSYDISIKLITESGPAGGNPLYEFFGQKSKLEKFCLDNDFPTNYIEKV